jgi:hypothetical protein
MDPTDFLRQFVPGYAELGDAERIAISNFTLLWSAVEGRVLKTNASPTSLLALASLLAQQGRLSERPFEDSVAFFRDRYFRDGEFTYRFAQLSFRARDRQALVEAVLCGREAELEHVVGALLLITYRLRNNLFHGVKWAYGIQGQQENFEHASAVLMNVLQLHNG